MSPSRPAPFPRSPAAVTSRSGGGGPAAPPQVPAPPPAVPGHAPARRERPGRHSPRQMAVSGTSAPCRSSAAAAFSMAGRRRLPFSAGGTTAAPGKLRARLASTRSRGSRRLGQPAVPPQAGGPGVARPPGAAAPWPLRAARSGAGGRGQTAAPPPLRRRRPT